MTDQEIYQKFIEYVKTPIWELTESEHRMPMLRSFLTPEEAAFLTGFPKRNTTFEEIAEIKEMDPDELLKKIKPLCRRGVRNR